MCAGPRFDSCLFAAFGKGARRLNRPRSRTTFATITEGPTHSEPEARSVEPDSQPAESPFLDRVTTIAPSARRACGGRD